MWELWQIFATRWLTAIIITRLNEYPQRGKIRMFEGGGSGLLHHPLPLRHVRGLLAGVNVQLRPHGRDVLIDGLGENVQAQSDSAGPSRPLPPQTLTPRSKSDRGVTL